jgi:hypothetical protein
VGGRQPAKWAPGNWLASAADLVRFLAAVNGSGGKSFLSPRLRSVMLALPPPPIKPNGEGAHVGLGWDLVKKFGQRYRYSKNGGKPGVRSWLQHLESGVDWAFLCNTDFDRRQHPFAAIKSKLTEESRALRRVLG